MAIVILGGLITSPAEPARAAVAVPALREAPARDVTHGRSRLASLGSPAGDLMEVNVDDAFDDASGRARRSISPSARRRYRYRSREPRALRQPPVHEVQAAHDQLLGQARPAQDRALLH